MVLLLALLKSSSWNCGFNNLSFQEEKNFVYLRMSSLQRGNNHLLRFIVSNTQYFEAISR